MKATLFCTLAVALLPSAEAADACGGCKTMIDQFKSVRAQQETLNHGFVVCSFFFSSSSLLPFSFFSFSCMQHVHLQPIVGGYVWISVCCIGAEAGGRDLFQRHTRVTSYLALLDTRSSRAVNVLLCCSFDWTTPSFGCSSSARTLCWCSASVPVPAMLRVKEGEGMYCSTTADPLTVLDTAHFWLGAMSLSCRTAR